MRILLDTNVLIPLEPDVATVAMRTVAAANLAALAAEAAAQMLLHPVVTYDIARDRQVVRRARLNVLAGKYPRLDHPPTVPTTMSAQIGSPALGSNDWVDDQLLAAVLVDAVDFLVSEDQGIHRKARVLGLTDRVLTIADAAALLRALFDTTPVPPPAVEWIRAADIGSTDPILDSLRRDYAPDFDEWLRKAKRSGRRGWAIRASGSALAAIVLMKKEHHEFGMRGRLLKLSTFKVSEGHRGLKYGELLLKAVFGHAAENHYDYIYATAFDKHAELHQLMHEFGFERLGGTTSLGEAILAKRLVRTPGDYLLDPLEFHRRLGPPAISLRPGRTFLVPIRPEYHRMLFPDYESQMTLSLDAADRPFGNALRKAYLCHSGIRKIQSGDVLLFYRSRDRKAVTAVGVVEGTLVSADPHAIARFVGRRTVYRYDEIIAMTTKDVLAVRFRQDRVLGEELGIATLVERGVVERAPQTIGGIRGEGYEWLKTVLAA